jgi:hypothetical protein
MVSGGVGAIIYGEPRLTNDIDIVVRLAPRDAKGLVEAFPPGAFYVPPLDVMREEAEREQHGHFNLLHTETMLRADVYLAGRDPLQEWGLARRRRMALGSVEGWVAAPEYVILQKLLHYRSGGSPRHLRDIGWMLRVSEGLIDRPLLEAKIAELGLGPEWHSAREARLDL